MDELELMRSVNFDWVMRLDSVWREHAFHVEDLNGDVLRTVSAGLDGLNDPGAQQALGFVLVGPAGVGKTHLLSTLRRTALDRGASFVLVDMTDVHDFWDTVLLGYVNSLEKESLDGRPLFQRVLCGLAEIGGQTIEHDRFLDELANRQAHEIGGETDRILRLLLSVHGKGTACEVRDIVRALVLLNVNDISLASLSYSWLQGLEIEEEDRSKLGFSKKQELPMNLVKGLSRTMGLLGPSVLCLDQLDAIVTQHHLATMADSSAEVSAEVNRSRAIIEGIGGGLGALFDVTARTLSVVTCLEGTWEILRSRALVSHMQRYRDAIPLRQVSTVEQAKELVAQRLLDAYSRQSFQPPYPTWPFREDSFAEVLGLSPRQILKLCDRCRQGFLVRGQIKEIQSFDCSCPQPEENTPDLDKLFRELISQQNASGFLSESAEDDLGGILRDACRLLVLENPVPEEVDPVVEAEKATGRGYSALHGRVRLVFRKEGDREEHFCMRVLQKRHPNSYQARLKAALTASGIDTALKRFRRLVVIRNVDVPSGAKSKQLTEKFTKAGGMFVSPDEEELRTVLALLQLEKKEKTSFEAWLRDRRLLRRLKLMRVLVPALCQPEEPDESGAEESPPVDQGEGVKTAGDRDQELHVLLGRILVGNRVQEEVGLPVEVLKKHTVILAGAGSGKTVLVRRIIEEVALLGIPSIVIDCANDLARLAEPWPDHPANWLPGDPEKASKYFRKTEVLLWTPGKSLGNPLVLAPLPDLAAVADDADELEDAVSMASETMKEIVAPGSTETSQHRLGVLNAALHYFAVRGGGSLDDLVNLLSDLPEEAGLGITDSGKLGRKMADSLRARIQTDVLLRQTGTPLDPAVLFGINGPSEKARVSVINFIGLPDLGMQQRFLNQLAMALFSWIKKNPCPPDRPMRGLMVIDEAKDFVPSTKSNVCKASMQRLAAQGRKYGLGLLFATQSPKDIEHTIIQNCFTQFYGQASSPAAQDVIKNQLRDRGGSGEDIPRLGTGRFYVHCPETMKVPVKISVPFCLTHHPASPLNDSEILDLARKSKIRGRLGVKD